MNIGLPKEIKNGEFRVALTPLRVAALVGDGHRVVVQTLAGAGSGFTDQAYIDAGAELVDDAAYAWNVDLVVKVKEPLPQEFQYLRPELGLFTFLHLAGEPDLATELLNKNVRAIAYETVCLADGSLPLLAPMSQIAGRVAMLFAAHFLQKNCMGSFKGKGKLFGGIAGIPAARVVILGGGNVGQHAARVALGLAADVIVFDQNEHCLQHLDLLFQGQLQTQLYSKKALQEKLAGCDVLIGAALVQGEHAPELLTREMIAMMDKGSVFVDVAIDQGGMSETSRATSYDDPTYEEEGVIHCCLPNLPASVAQSSSEALGAASFPYLKELATLGLEKAIAANPALAQGVNTWDGELRHAGVIKALAL
ncbi:alanine dehydrogenase [Mariprofundus sp. EBB-1]|uniref:alanine dehydrogenase n=1 Tax=Mariprofundus sp. EBB-1 TaxID=2650971 RepID=UPI000EF1B11D|nr:alanine dehydrogenase [Mariprofundus sp. EBB-1]RLL53297.1 alanine dehydrogenase [Mariprofundus sp. EBB-1]